MSPKSASLKVGSWCTGYGGIELGLAMAGVPHSLAYVSEIDRAASKVLAARFPQAPNLGDLRAVDWSAVEPVDLLTGGFPCQPVSLAGRGNGLNDERWLFDDIAEGIGAMGRARPRMLWFENVPGLLSANRGHAMARVVSRLAALGYVGRYRLLRASDVGAPHRRERVFIAARLADTPGLGPWQRTAAAWARLQAQAVAGSAATLLPTPTTSEASGPGRLDGYRNDTLRAQVALLKTPTASLATNGGSQHPDKRKDGGHGPTLADEVEFLLPTPRASDGAKGSPNQHGSRGDLMLSSAVAQLLPTPTTVDARDTRNATAGRREGASFHGGVTLGDVAYADMWGQFAGAIARWERVLGRPAPAPTEPSKMGGQRLTARFVEWMLGLPYQHVTGVAGLTRNDQLQVLGNGVVPQQFALALAVLSD